MRKNKVVDERLQGIRMKAWSELGSLLSILLVIDIVYKAYVLNTSEHAEVFILLIGLVYVILRQISLGDIEEKNDKFLIKVKYHILLLGGVLTIGFGMLNYSQYYQKYTGIFDMRFLVALLIFFLSNIVLIGGLCIIINIFNSKKQKSLEKEIE